MELHRGHCSGYRGSSTCVRELLNRKQRTRIRATRVAFYKPYIYPGHSLYLNLTVYGLQYQYDTSCDRVDILVNPPLDSLEHEWRLNHEIHSAVHKAVRDFVSSWYRNLLPEVEGEFERVVRNSMLESVMELKERARQVDRKVLVERLLELYGCHLQSYMTARQIQSTQKDSFSLWQLYSEVDAPHPAVSSAATELSYSRALVNLVLHVLVPYPHMESRTGGYVVTELITCNVLLPLISRVSDPDWLNQIIVDIFTRTREPQGNSVDELPAAALCTSQESWTTCRSMSASEQVGLPSKSTSDLYDPQRQSRISESDSSQGSLFSLTSTEKIENCHTGLLTPCKVNCCSLTSGHYAHSSESKMIPSDSIIQSDSEDDLTGGFCDCGPPSNFCNIITLKDNEAFGCFGPLRTLGPKVVVHEDSLWPASIAQGNSPSCPRRRFHLTSYNFDTPNIPTVPVNIQNVHISGTVTAKEQRGTNIHPCTLYTIKFEALAGAEKDATQQPAACHTVKRRYSEFLNLQTRLEENPEMKKLIKNVKGPKKMFPDLPFGNTDSEKVEARKSQLDTFLKQLSSIAETANSEDMKEFLALNAEAYTYFDRKPVVKSKIDKMMGNALDTLKTAFPYPEIVSPTEDLDGDGDGRILDNRKYRWLDVGVAHLTSASCWVIYLQVLQETVWPGGTLPAQPRPERSAAERGETKEACLKCLMQLLPELITDMLGSEKYRLSVETMLDSLQDYQINKHLIYCICDLLLELLIPESFDELFQKSLLQNLAKETESVK
ncbi:Sorting nexin-19 [Channa argus]|uniref:Sorting nexin-19 n=1 Tax=Channa argus TaxID=215402 RepID=A0A6G1QTE1_CHAAH|nr:Sorting nexin-19 [Channa argus]